MPSARIPEKRCDDCRNPLMPGRPGHLAASPGWARTTSSSFLLVALGAALWGTDPLFRFGLALHVAAPAIVLAEQVLPLPLLAPAIWRGLKRMVSEFSLWDWGNVVLVGAGASALATLLFTQAFTFGSPETPVLLQQLQPLFAVSGARLLLGERLQPRYWLFLAGALSGGYLIAFADPQRVDLAGSVAALMAVGAAALWGTGTVLGRRLVGRMTFSELTGLRLAFGAVAALIVVVFTGTFREYFTLNYHAGLSLLLLALVPGVLGLLIYYRGLRGTPAAAATLAELAFPLTALLVGYVAFHATLTRSQWLGVVVLTGTITAMGLLRSQGVPTGVQWSSAPDTPPSCAGLSASTPATGSQCRR
jgi:DME family drug/metabolite transporter